MLFDKINLEEDEKIITTVRKHWFVIMVELFGICFVGVLPLILAISMLALPTTSAPYIFFSEYFDMVIFGLAAWFLFTVIAAMTSWSNYFLDLWVITDRRIIVIEQVTYFNRKVSNFRLERLQDIKVTISGVIPTLLNYGTIRAQTASSAESNFVSDALPAPRELQSIIQTAMDARLAKLGDAISPVLE